MKKKHNNKLHHEVLIMLGAFIIFCSWIVQNFIENNYKMQREKIEREKNYINELASYASNYESSGDGLDSTKIALSRRNYILPVLKLFEISKKYWSDTIKVGELNRRTDTLKVQKMFENRQYNRLNIIAENIKKEKEENEFGVIMGFYDHYQKICDKETTSNWIFVIIYALGAVVSGAGMYLKKKKEIKEDNSE